jgi:hypothetical protein
MKRPDQKIQWLESGRFGKSEYHKAFAFSEKFHL